MDASAVDRPFAPPLECLIHLPAPPSTNALWKPKTTRAGFYTSPGYRRWVAQADVAIMLAGGVQKLTKMPGMYTVTITLNEQLSHLDLDNSPKALIDYCRRRLQLMRDDDKRYMREVTLRWGNTPSGCSILLRSLP